MRITAIKPRGGRGDRYAVFVDGRFLCDVGGDVIVARGLFVGREVDEGELDGMAVRDGVSRAKRAAYYLLNHRLRSTEELRRKLMEKGYDESSIEEALKEIEEEGYIDDAHFAAEWSRDRMSGKKFGRRRIESELRRMGVSDEIIDEQLDATYDGVDEVELAVRAISPRLRSYRSLDPLKARRRAYGFLARKGFDPDTIAEALRRVFPDSSG
ncbi:MAG: regulatory protein RecX [bacterium]